MLIMFHWINHMKIFIYDVARKTLCGAKALGIIFDKVNDYIKKHDRINI